MPTQLKGRKMKGSSKPGSPAGGNRTKKAFRKALLELVAEKPFRSVSVQDLVSRSGYGRSTFYLHFHDKFDLSDWVIDDEAESYVDSINNAIILNMPVDNDESVYQTCYMILKQQMDNRDFYNAIIHELIPGYTTSIFADKTYQLLMKTFDYPTSYWNEEIDHDFYYYILTNTLIDQIKYWEKHGYKLSLKEMSIQARALHYMWGYKSIMLK